MLKKITFFFLMLIFTLLMWQCKKSVPLIEYDRYPIQISGNFLIDGVDVNWSQVKSSDFIQYRIWRSITSDTIPDKPILNVNSAVNVGSFADYEKINFKDINTSAINAGRAYYRVEAVLKNRSVWSRNVLISNGDNEIFTNITSVAYDKEKQIIYMMEQSSQRIFVFYSKIGKVAKIIDTGSFSTNPSNLIIGKKGGKGELYLVQNGLLQIFSTDNFSLIASINLSQKNIGNSIFINTDGNGKVFISTDDNKLVVINRDDNSIKINDNSQLTSTFSRFYSIPNSNALFFVENLSPYTIGVVTLDASKMQIVDTEIKKELKTSVVFSNDFTRNFVINPNEFIVSGKGYVFNRSLISLGRLLTTNNTSTTAPFKDIQVIDKENFLSVGNGFTTSSYSVNRWLTPNISVKETFVSNAVTPVAIVPFDDKIWVVNFNSTLSKTTIFQIKI